MMTESRHEYDDHDETDMAPFEHDPTSLPIADDSEPPPMIARHYQLQSPVGMEELATVYRAVHTTLHHTVHVHILRHTDADSYHRFQLAATLASDLTHPNLVPVVDSGHDEAYGSYMVTPVIEGTPLSTMVMGTATGRPLEPLLALRVMTQVAAVLDYLHSQNIIHRDVQPANILVTQDGIAYLTNLSLAASPYTPTFDALDAANYVTPYTAPEQRFTAQDTESALDIYSLGGVAYTLFSGKLPSPSTEDLPSLTEYDPSLAEVDAIVRKMMAIEPSARSDSAGDAATALRRALHPHLEQPSEMMDESEWVVAAEWLENPLETVAGDLLDQHFLSKSLTRTDTLHRNDSIRRQLNRWSRRGMFRRQGLGDAIQLQQMVSYNIYFYELRVTYEVRRVLEPRQTMLTTAEEKGSLLPAPALWEVTVPEISPNTEVNETEVLWPNASRVVRCPECREAHGERGEAQLSCPVCGGSGRLLEERAFAWSRRISTLQKTDDIEELPQLALQQRAQEVYHATLNPYEGRWHSVAPMAELLREAIAEVDDSTRIKDAELIIRGVPITEIDFWLHNDVQRLYIVGFDNHVVGTWALLSPKRMIVAAVVIVGALSLLIALFMLIF